MTKALGAMTAGPNRVGINFESLVGNRHLSKGALVNYKFLRLGCLAQGKKIKDIYGHFGFKHKTQEDLLSVGNEKGRIY